MLKKSLLTQLLRLSCEYKIDLRNIVTMTEEEAVALLNADRAALIRNETKKFYATLLREFVEGSPELWKQAEAAEYASKKDAKKATAKAATIKAPGKAVKKDYDAINVDIQSNPFNSKAMTAKQLDLIMSLLAEYIVECKELSTMNMSTASMWINNTLDKKDAGDIKRRAQKKDKKALLKIFIDRYPLEYRKIVER